MIRVVGPEATGPVRSPRLEEEGLVPRVLAVDGNSLGHRAYHARRHEEPAGPHVTGTVVRMLASAWPEGPYDAVLIAFDAPDNRRKQLHPGYKANRPPTPEELTGQLVALRGHLEAAGLSVATAPGAEADDLLASTADACAARGWRCDLLSSDRDLTALVGPTTRLLRPRATMADLVVEDEARVRATYGIDAHQYTDLAAMRGDPSDGLDGVHGIGPKTAARLLRDHGSVPQLYQALHDLPPRIEAALRAGREQVERNLLLMAPLPNLPVDVEAVVAAGIDLERVERVLEPLGLGSAARRLRAAVTAPPPPPAPPPPLDEPDAAPASEPAHVRMPAPVAVARQGEQAALF
jgi:5'-3' exonuclease